MPASGPFPTLCTCCCCDRDPSLNHPPTRHAGPSQSPLFPPPPDPGPRYLLHTLMSLLPTAPVPAHLPTPKTAARDTLLPTALFVATPQSCHFGLHPPLSPRLRCKKESGKKKSLFRVTRAASGPRVRPPLLPDASRSSRLPCVLHIQSHGHAGQCGTYVSKYYLLSSNSTMYVHFALPALLACTL